MIEMKIATDGILVYNKSLDSSACPASDLRASIILAQALLRVSRSRKDSLSRMPSSHKALIGEQLERVDLVIEKVNDYIATLTNVLQWLLRERSNTYRKGVERSFTQKRKEISGRWHCCCYRGRKRRCGGAVLVM